MSAGWQEHTLLGVIAGLITMKLKQGTHLWRTLNLEAPSNHPLN